jgi:hypothetical protein
MRATVITLLAIAIGLFVYNPVALANHSGSTDPTWHSDVMTINQTGSLGIFGTAFVPAWVKTDCDTPVAQGRNISTDNPAATGCHAFGEEVVRTWLNGEWWDPRGGTEFIPPSGDHHRAGWRLMLQAHFSAGAWLAGFAPIATTFPFYPQIGAGAGPGETPVGTYELCMDADGAGGGTAAYDGTLMTVTTDDAAMEDSNLPGTPAENAVITYCRTLARRAGAMLLEFVDHHGEPLTPGRFPRYIPHERQAWVQTVVTKYTASPTNNVDITGDGISDESGARVSQVFRSQHSFVTDRVVTWVSMSDESAGGCGTGWCQWLWDRDTGILTKVESADPNNPLPVDPNDANWLAAGEVTTISVVDDYTDMSVTKTLSAIEKAPSEIYQVIGQWVQLASGTGPLFNEGNTSGPTSNKDNQAFWQEFWGLSGPNFQAEEGASPYTWVLCGNPADSDANTPCAGVASGAIDAPGGNTMAITQFGLDVINRYGGDLRPDDSTDQGRYCVGGDPQGSCLEANTTTGGLGGTCDTLDDGIGGNCDKGLYTAIVQCTATGDTDGDPKTSACLSSHPSANAYGQAPDDILYYREAVENLQRGFIRENAAHSFSFINGAGVNNGFPGSGLSTTLRQAVAQNINELGFLMSCMNCEDRPEHQVATHPLPNYQFNWSVSGVGFVEHSDIITPGFTGVIP